MKFSDGLWLNQRGYEVSYAAQAYEVTTTQNAIHVFATANAIWNRAMTLGGVTFEIVYTAIAPDVIRVQIAHHKGGLKNKPQFELNLPEGYVPEGARPFESLVPLPEVIAASEGGSAAGKKVGAKYEAMLEGLGPEFTILLSLIHI